MNVIQLGNKGHGKKIMQGLVEPEKSHADDNVPQTMQNNGKT